jgi:flagellar basal body-associated protein FliL
VAVTDFGPSTFHPRQPTDERGSPVSILWIILIIVLVLLLLGFFSRGRW